MSDRRRTPSCCSLRLLDLTRPCVVRRVLAGPQVCVDPIQVRVGKVYPGVVEFGLDADQVAFLFVLGS